MQRFRDGEAAAFAALLDRHKRPMLGFLRRSAPRSADAEDLFQEVFLRVIKAAPRWKHEAKVTTWMYTIARNVVIDAARRGNTRPPEVSLDGGDRTDGVGPVERVRDRRPGAERQLLSRESHTAIDELVAGLPEAQREAFLLKRRGLTFEAIAEVTEVSKNTVKSRLRYALDKLRAGLAERGLLDGEDRKR